MNTEEYIGFLKKQGHEVRFCDGSYWLRKNRFHWLNVPSLIPVNRSLKSIVHSFVKTRACLLTFLTDAAQSNTYEYVFSGFHYSLEDFSSKIRNQIKTGLKKCLVKEPDFADILEQGFDVNLQVFKKQSRFEPVLCDFNKWQNYCNLLRTQNDVWIRAAYVEDRLVAYCVFMLIETKIYILHPFMNYSYSSCCPMNAILYSFINEFIRNNGSITVSYGLASFVEMQSLDRFKNNMLFKKSPVCRIVAVNPIVRLLFNRSIFSCLRLLGRYIPSSFGEFLDGEFWDKQKRLYYSTIFSLNR